MTYRSLTKLLGVAACACWFILLGGSAVASPTEEGPGTMLSLEAGWRDKYVWRGMPLSEEGVVQASATLAGGGFSLNLWTNLDTTDWGEEAGYGDQAGNVTEIDFSGAYEHGFGPVVIGLGFSTYSYPNTAEGATAKEPSTTEVFLSAGLDVPGSPTLTCSVDGDQAEGANYAALTVGHAFHLLEADALGVELEVGAAVGYANQKFIRYYYGIMDEGDDWHDWSVDAALAFGLPAGLTLTTAYRYDALINHALRDEVEEVWDLEPEGGVFSVTLGWAYPAE